ncbi:glycosyltransferase [Myroides sp. DF42-4-2]|nr:glycosyltransferase [Myroides sp. DF42-4-2]
MYVYLFMPQRKIKIALVGDTLAYGGAERIHSSLSIHLEQEGYEVHNLLNLNVITYPYGGVLYNLGVHKSTGFSLRNKWKRYRLFRNYIKTQGFDYVIDFRTRSKPLTEVLLQCFVFDATYIPTIHSSELSWYFTSNLFLGKHLYRKSKQIICVSQAIAEKVKATYRYKQVQTIYNPIPIDSIREQANQPHSFQGKRYIVACGRMDSDLKQFDRLIELYSRSKLPKEEIHLVILGEGRYKQQLVDQIAQHQLAAWVHLPGFCENPFPIFKGALYFVHSSRLEGFPTVLLEALACEIPIISFDCPTGPSEIIQDQYNGFLIEDQDFEALKTAMDVLALDTEMRNRIKQNTLKTAYAFDMDVIKKEWLNLLQ